MWNYNLIINPKFKKQTMELSQKLNNISGTQSKLEKNKEYINLTISANNVHKIKETILTNIAYFIVDIYKSEFFYNTLKNQPLPKTHKECLCKALTLFDIETDIFLTLTQLTEKDRVVVDSFYVFKMGKLRQKWQEFANVSCLNSPMLKNSDIYVEFLKFLYNCIIPQTEVVNVYIKSTEFVFTDANSNTLISPINLQDEIGLITNLIYLAPKVVNLHCINQISNKAFKALYYIFNKKINII